MAIQPPDGVWITYQTQYRKCGKHCKGCTPPAKGHGPYDYAYWRDPATKKLRSAYLGKAPKQPEQPEREQNHVNRTHHVNQH